MITAATFDWSAFGYALATLFIAFMQVLAAYREKKAKMVRDEIHTLVNSNMGEALFTGMVSAKALLIAKRTPENIELFKAAERKWMDHQKKQDTVDDAAAEHES